MTNLDLQFVDQIVAKLGRQAEASIAILQAIQEHYRYLPAEAIARVCQITQITPAQVQGVATFYTQFRSTPVGRHVISLCHGTACHVKGSQRIHDALCRHLNLSAGQDTDDDGIFTVRKVACLGCCTLAPAMQIDGVTFGHLTPQAIAGTLKDFLLLQKLRPGKLPARPADRSCDGDIRIGLGSCCQARGSANVQLAVAEALAELGANVSIKAVGCVGMCHQTPLLDISAGDRPAVTYAQVQPGDVRDIIRKHFRSGSLRRRLLARASGVIDRLLTDEAWDQPSRHPMTEVETESFLAPQVHIATELAGTIDPIDLDEYIAAGGFTALRLCADELPAERIIQMVRDSGLRGRGGAGYPTGLKWQQVRQQESDRKYVICNGDEGDPGAFMDRMLLESYPYRIIEGLAIAARAVGACEGIFYIRAEYPLACERVGLALEQCRRRGLIGPGAWGGKFPLELRIVQGAGAFVCGEETALIASVEGLRGMPRLRPPYPAQAGLWGRPTLVNNVETFALVPWIIRKGPEAFAKLGQAGSRGTKVFALAGKVARGGLVEVPMGMTIRQIVQDIGGGVAGGKKFKAVQIGGPSGGCVPQALADLPVDYEALTQAGAIMGSGGLVVLDEDDCMVEIARYFLQFTQDQSCGRCTFCRVGTRRMLDIMDRLCEGNARPGDLDELETLALTVRRGSLCGLGRTAPNPVLSTLKHFRQEYQAHLAGRCPAGRCKALIRYTITDDCIGCTLCAQHCPAEAIQMRPFEKHVIDATKCVRCDTCRSVCPSNAVKVE
jgi:NADH-quinone oxidoreductase subunit F